MKIEEIKIGKKYYLIQTIQSGSFIAKGLCYATHHKHIFFKDLEFIFNSIPQLNIEKDGGVDSWAWKQNEPTTTINVDNEYVFEFEDDNSAILYLEVK